MGAFRATTSFLSMKPSVYGDDEVLYCESSLFAQAATLFACYHQVAVDRRRQVIFLYDRTWWVRRRELEIPFSLVDHIEYDFDEVPIGLSQLVGVRSSVETFTVSLVLREGGGSIPLARFRGEESRLGGGVILGRGVVRLASDEILEVTGDQENTSLLFVSALKSMLGVPVGKPAPYISNQAGRKHRCTACGQDSPPHREKCQYCGGRVEAIGDAV